jgi:hypothetical protein
MKNIITLSVVVLFFSCQQTPPTQEAKSYFCSPQLETFFSGSDSLPVIEFSHTDTFAIIKKRLLQFIDTTQTDYDFNTYFKIKLKLDSFLVYTKVCIKHLFPQMECFPKPNSVDIRINSLGQYLIDGEYVDTSTIREMVIKNITNWGKDFYYSDSPLKAVTIIVWDYHTPEIDFNNAFKAIISGYTEVLNQASLTRYKKGFCSLTTTQADSIIVGYNFRLQLGYYELLPDFDFPID